ncbi:MAG: trypsin-like peptidase domain-containing protein [Bacteroidota bacterium]
MPKIHHALVFMMLVTACTEPQPPKETETVAPKKMTVENLLQKQVLLTNHAVFTKDRELNGASAFLVRYKDSVYAVTAKHLLGPDGGVEPAVSLIQLYGDVKSWKLYPRQPVNPATDTVTVNAARLDYSEMPRSSDAVILSTVDFKSGIEPLVPNFATPAEGDTMYLIGCPYSDKECRQNSYKMTFKSQDKGMVLCQIFSEVDLRGFSGAPIVNTSGEVVAIVYGSGDAEGAHYVYATPIGDVRKVRVVK